MSPLQYKKVIQKELQKLNERIDYKILHGERYSEESRKHKALLRQIRNQESKHGIFNRMFVSA